MDWKPMEINVFGFETSPECCLHLVVKDKKGKEYIDGSIVKIIREEKEILGFVRYSYGRFEIVCPFKNQRFVYGLNPAYEIVGHLVTDRILILNQEEKEYGK